MARRFVGALLLAAALSVLTHWVVDEPPWLLWVFLGLFVSGMRLLAARPAGRQPAAMLPAQFATEMTRGQPPKPPEERKVFRYRSMRPAAAFLSWMLFAWGISWVEAVRMGEYLVVIYSGPTLLGPAMYLVLVAWVQGKHRLICTADGLILEQMRSRVRLRWNEVDSLFVKTPLLGEAPSGSVYRVSSAERSMVFHAGLESADELAACISLATGLQWQIEDASSGG